MTAAVSITSDGGKIDGIIAETNGQKYKIKAKAVILATGGFGNNSKLFSTLNPDLKGFVSTNHPGATGDAIELVEKYNVADNAWQMITEIPNEVKGFGVVAYNSKISRTASACSGIMVSLQSFLS